MMRRRLQIAGTAALLLPILAAGGYFFNEYWIHRYDALIKRHAEVYNVEPELVWSIIYEETYFSAWKIGNDREVGLMQVTPAVARRWGKETGLKEFERETAENLEAFLSDPERNIQVGCWYLEQISAKYRDLPAEKAMSLAAYNAGPSRVDEWTYGSDQQKLSPEEFLSKIDIATTRSYVSSILKRYQWAKQAKLFER